MRARHSARPPPLLLTTTGVAEGILSPTSWRGEWQAPTEPEASDLYGRGLPRKVGKIKEPRPRSAGLSGPSGVEDSLSVEAVVGVGPEVVA
jgi:hypothetical protein